jgi:thioesterase domain-containing protein/acyl carrier protein
MAPRAGGGGGPSSPVEQKLVEIWRDVLGVPSVDVDDDFFDLGGHSLLAVRLMARIETELGRTLALATLFEARTVRQIADVIEERTKLARWSCLVPIQPEGPRPPFFCVHGVGGEVLSYLALASHMAPDQPFVAIRAAGYDGQSEPVHTIEDQAALYIREMLAYQPVGPYYIGGYSHGGRVALEMALQLERMDHEVAFIGILDTTPFEVRYNSLKYWGRMLRNVPLWFWYDAMRTPWRENRDRLSRAWRLVRRVAAARRHGPHSGEPAMKPDLSDSMNLTKLPDRIRRMYVMDYDAFLAYRPNGQCERVTVFRSRGQPLFASHEPDLNWRRVTKGEVRVRHVPGNHSSILAEPDVRVLANELRAALAEAQHDVTPAVTPTRVPAA